jgi:hypothetical protein
MDRRRLAESHTRGFEDGDIEPTKAIQRWTNRSTHGEQAKD